MFYLSFTLFLVVDLSIASPSLPLPRSAHVRDHRVLTSWYHSGRSLGLPPTLPSPLSQFAPANSSLLVSVEPVNSSLFDSVEPAISSLVRSIRKYSHPPLPKSPSRSRIDLRFAPMATAQSTTPFPVSPSATTYPPPPFHGGYYCYPPPFPYAATYPYTHPAAAYPPPPGFFSAPPPGSFPPPVYGPSTYPPPLFPGGYYSAPPSFPDAVPNPYSPQVHAPPSESPSPHTPAPPTSGVSLTYMLPDHDSVSALPAAPTPNEPHGSDGSYSSSRGHETEEDGSATPRKDCALQIEKSGSATPRKACGFHTERSGSATPRKDCALQVEKTGGDAHPVPPDFTSQGRDLTKENGAGDASISDEKLVHKHGPGLVSMVNNAPDHSFVRLQATSTPTASGSATPGTSSSRVFSVSPMSPSAALARIVSHVFDEVPTPSSCNGTAGYDHYCSGHQTPAQFSGVQEGSTNLHERNLFGEMTTPIFQEEKHGTVSDLCSWQHKLIQNSCVSNLSEQYLDELPTPACDSVPVSHLSAVPSTTACVVPPVCGEMPTPKPNPREYSSPLHYYQEQEDSVQSTLVPGGNSNLPEQHLDVMPQPYGFDNLSRQSIIRADGTEQRYYELPEDYPLEHATDG